MQFYNTTNLTGTPLQQSILRVDKQHERIELLFKKHKPKMTPYEVMKLYESLTGQPILITSVRRTMSDMTKGDNPVLVKTPDKRESPYSTDKRKCFEHYWEINQS